MSEYEQGAQGQATAPAAPGMWEPSRRQMFDPRRKSPFLAAALSVIPGIGQIYIGYYLRGIATAAVFLIAVMITAEVNSGVGPFFMLAAIFIWVFNLIDAGRMAALYNHAAAGSNAITMPADLKLPRLGGSIMGGLLLLLFGGIALSNTAFGYSLDWLEQWWPAFPLGLGAWLLLRGFLDFMSARETEKAPGD